MYMYKFISCFKTVFVCLDQFDFAIEFAFFELITRRKNTFLNVLFALFLLLLCFVSQHFQNESCTLIWAGASE